jgi:hypothetical protein
MFRPRKPRRRDRASAPVLGRGRGPPSMSTLLCREKAEMQPLHTAKELDLERIIAGPPNWNTVAGCGQARQLHPVSYHDMSGLLRLDPPLSLPSTCTGFAKERPLVELSLSCAVLAAL